MSFQYETGTADDIPDLFDKLETLLVAAGWTIESGSGTTTIIVKSTGEAGGRTKLYSRIRRSTPANTHRVYGRMQDDLAGTNSTSDPDDAQTGYLSAPGTGDTPFVYFICADKDMISINFKAGAGYSGYYIGVVEPFAATIPDEEYQYVICGLHMRVTAPVRSGRVLRDSSHNWNSLIYTYENSDAYIKHPLTNTYPVIGGYAQWGNTKQIVGEFLNVSGKMRDVVGLNPEDTITTGMSGATTTWIVLGTLTKRWAIRTGGIEPSGILEAAHFATATGVANTLAAFIGIVQAFMTARGFTQVANPAPTFPTDYYMNSPGESGSDDIWQRWRYDDVQGRFGCYAMDDYGDSNRTIYDDIGTAANKLLPGSFPTTYWLVGDRDRIAICVLNGGANQWMWAGLLETFHPDPSIVDTVYKNAVMTRLLRGADGVWSKALATSFDNYNASTPQELDGVSVVVWPFACKEASGGNVLSGVYPYVHKIDDTGLAAADTVTVGSRVFMVIGATDEGIRIG